MTKITAHRLDHIVVTCANQAASEEFYTKVLGMELVTFGQRKALQFTEGRQKINLHQAGQEL